MSDRLNHALMMNEDFAKAYAKQEKWAVDYADAVLALDGQASRRFPERNREEQGRPRNWCGCCPFKEGCMSCDLPYDHSMRNMIGTIDDGRNPYGQLKPTNKDKDRKR